jgi:hypothetical protein
LLQSLGKNATKCQVIQALVVALNLECGFIGDWCFCDGIENAYNISWTSLTDRRIMKNFAILRTTAQDDDAAQILKFKFALAPQNEISLICLESGDLIIMTAIRSSLDGNSVNSTRSLAIVTSRYFVTKKLNSSNVSASFRNLRELSIKVKNELFLPLRNDIFCESSCKSLYPSLNGLPEDCLLLIFRYLKSKDIVNLSLSCKNIRETSVPYLKKKE